MQGKMWRVIKGMYESSRSAVLLEGEKSEVFNVEQGVAQGCTVKPPITDPPKSSRPPNNGRVPGTD